MIKISPYYYLILYFFEYYYCCYNRKGEGVSKLQKFQCFLLQIYLKTNPKQMNTIFQFYKGIVLLIDN